MARINIVDVITSVGSYNYLRIVHNVNSSPMLEIDEHIFNDECENCSRFMGYHAPPVRTDGSPRYVYRILPFYPSCRKGIDIIVNYFFGNNTYTIVRNRLGNARHGDMPIDIRESA